MLSPHFTDGTLRLREIAAGICGLQGSIPWSPEGTPVISLGLSDYFPQEESCPGHLHGRPGFQSLHFLALSSAFQMLWLRPGTGDVRAGLKPSRSLPLPLLIPSLWVSWGVYTCSSLKVEAWGPASQHSATGLAFGSRGCGVLWQWALFPHRQVAVASLAPDGPMCSWIASALGVVDLRQRPALPWAGSWSRSLRGLWLANLPG